MNGYSPLLAQMVLQFFVIRLRAQPQASFKLLLPDADIGVVDVSPDEQPQCSTGCIAKITLERHRETTRNRKTMLGWPCLSGSLQFFKFLPNCFKFCSRVQAVIFPSLAFLGNNKHLSLQPTDFAFKIWSSWQQCWRRGRNLKSINSINWLLRTEAMCY